MTAVTQPDSATSTTATGETLALKEWGAVVVALLAGRQTVLLRKGGIHEKVFRVGSGHFLIFPTVAHSHADRVRPEHRDLLAPGEAQVEADTFQVRCGVALVDVVEVVRPDRLESIQDTHIWTHDSVVTDRLAFRPRHPLTALTVRAFALPEPLTLERVEAYGGCRSWLDLPVSWDGLQGHQVVTEERLAADAARVRAALA